MFIERGFASEGQGQWNRAANPVPPMVTSGVFEGRGLGVGVGRRYSLGVSLEHGAHRLHLVLVELPLGVAPQDRHGARDLAVHVARVGRDQHHRLKCRNGSFSGRYENHSVEAQRKRSRHEFFPPERDMYLGSLCCNGNEESLCRHFLRHISQIADKIPAPKKENKALTCTAILKSLVLEE